MKTTQTIRDNWKIYAEHGDILAIAEESEISRQTISKAIDTGEMSEKVFKAIDDFYVKRKKLLIKAAQQVAKK